MSEIDKLWSDEPEQVRCADCDLQVTVYADEVRAFYRFHRCYPPPERAILTRLFAELRQSMAELSDTRYVADEGMDPQDWVGVYVDRAEARLREVTGG